MRLGELLVQKGLINEKLLQIALEIQKITGEKLGELLVRLGVIRKKDLVEVLSEILTPEELVDEIEFDIFLPVREIIEYKILPIKETEQKVFIATINPNREEVLKVVKKYTGDKDIIFVPVNTEEIYKFLQEIEKDYLEELGIEVSEDPQSYAERIIRKAILEKATDIHIETWEKEGTIRFRIDTVLHFRDIKPKKYIEEVIAVIKDRSGMDVAERMIPQDGSFTVTVRKRIVDIRVATLPTVWGEKVTMRLLDRERGLLRIEELGITRLDIWKRLSTLPYGLILVCGPTGSGKTTTLYSTVRYLINYLEKAVYTVENPVEYHLPFINQTQVNKKVGNTFERFTIATMRHDPDVIIVGETRSKETANTTLELAGTGHLVYTTLHTDDVRQSIQRLQTLGADWFYLKVLLKGILVQRLVRKLCPICKGKGCNYCNFTGYKGVTVVTEIAELKTPDDFDMLVEGKLKYHTFFDDVVIKLKQGITDLKEIKRVFGSYFDYEKIEEALK